MSGECPSLPPGVIGNFSTANEGGYGSWRDLSPTRYYTSVFIIKDGQILLGKKKRGFGVNYYLGFGGKIEPGETSPDAALRELKEEAGVSADIRPAGILHFTKEGLDWNFHIDIYRATHYDGAIIETEEMVPEWFPIDKIPYDQMWGSDRHWLPYVIADTYFVGRTDFSADDGLQKWWFGLSTNSGNQS